MNAHSTHPVRSSCALLATVGCLALAPMDGRATVMLRSYTVLDLGAPSSFAFADSLPLVGATGLQQVTTSVIGVFGDGLRNGASLTPFITANLVTGSLVGPGNVLQTVNSVGGAASFGPAGGTAGAIQMGTAGVVSFSSPTTFQFNFTQPINFSRDVTSQTNLGAAVMDFFGDGASLTGNTPAGRLSSFAFNNTTHTELGPSFSAVGLGAAELDSGVATIGCSELALCNETEFGFNFILSAIGDGAALIARQEIGGDPIVGTVMQIYALASQTSVFDCGTGCGLSQIELSFTATGGSDAYGFIVRQEVIPFVSPVPEPASIALVGLGLAGWFVMRRRAQRTPVPG